MDALMTKRMFLAGAATVALGGPAHAAKRAAGGFVDVSALRAKGSWQIADWVAAWLPGLLLQSFAGRQGGNGVHASINTVSFGNNGGSALTSGTDFGGATLTTVNFQNNNLVGDDFAGANIGGTTSFGGENLTDVNFSGAHITGTYFGFANLTGANFTGATLTGETSADFAEATCPDGTLAANDGFTCLNNLG